MCHLWPTLDLEADSPEALKALYRAAYVSRYVVDGEGVLRTILDWRGKQCRFAAETFDHAFTQSDDHTLGLEHTNELAVERARRLPWIEATLRGDVGMYVRHTQRTKKSGRRRLKPVNRRVILVPDEQYLVVMTRNNDGSLEFVTAFCPGTEGWRRAMTEGSEVDRRNISAS